MAKLTDIYCDQCKEKFIEGEVVVRIKNNATGEYECNFHAHVCIEEYCKERKEPSKH